jgi:general secretion pathway protein F
MLSDANRAEIFQGLARTLSAGLDATQALTALSGVANGKFDDAIARALKIAGKGASVTHALNHNGLISPHDRPLLGIAETNGTLQYACEQLAQRYQRVDARWRQLKGRLLMPLAVLLIAIIVLPLPALVAGKLSSTDYVVQVVSMLMLMALLAKLISSVIGNWRSNGTPAWLTHIARTLPMIRIMSQLHQRADTGENLALALRCGAPAHDALSLMIGSEKNGVRKAALNQVHRKLRAGADLTSALQHAELLDATGFAIVSSGEGAGRLEESLKRVSEQYFDDLDGYYSIIAQWLPVFVYLCVAGVVAVGLIG